MPFPDNIAATNIVAKAIATANTVVAANIAPHMDKDKERDEKAYGDPTKDRSSKAIAIAYMVVAVNIAPHMNKDKERDEKAYEHRIKGETDKAVDTACCCQ